MLLACHQLLVITLHNPARLASQGSMHTHTCTHTCTHTHALTHMHSHMHAHTCTDSGQAKHEEDIDSACVAAGVKSVGAWGDSHCSDVLVVALHRRQGGGHVTPHPWEDT